MRMKASVPDRRGGCSTINWSKGTPAGEATARASAAVTAAGLSRRSTTTISLPMPFILANAWLASALMELPELCLSYMANDGGLTSLQGGMTHLVMGRKRNLRVRNGGVFAEHGPGLAATTANGDGEF